MIEVHDGSISAPVSAVDGNIAVFAQSGAALVDSEVKASDLLLKGATHITVTNGLSASGELGSEEGLTISHDVVTVSDETEGDVITDITVNEYGHVTSITRGEGNKLILERNADETGAWLDGGNLAAGLQISGISLNSNTLSVFASKIPGKVRVSSEAGLKYLGEAIIGKNTELVDNEYSVSVKPNENNDELQLSVVIDKIDGGTF